MTVWAGMATLLDRRQPRRAAIESLLPQVDRLTVTPGDQIGDQAKFASCAHAPDIFLAVDDDLVYPADYAARIVAALDQHPGCIVAYHGSSYTAAGELAENHRCLDTVHGEHRVQMVGTGVCAFHVTTIRPLLADFPERNCADAWLAVKAAREHVPMVVLPHTAGWIRYTPPGRTIWDETQDRTGSRLDAGRGFQAGLAELLRLHHG